MNLSESFSRIYSLRFWGPRSGLGSSPRHTVRTRGLLRSMLESPEFFGAQIVDIGCGYAYDFWSSVQLGRPAVHYHGIEVVPHVANATRDEIRRLHGSTFMASRVSCGDFLSEEALCLVEADVNDDYPLLILCKDVLQHLTNEEAYAVVDRIRLMLRNRRASKCASAAMIVADVTDRAELREVDPKTRKSAPFGVFDFGVPVTIEESVNTKGDEVTKSVWVV